ncbi:putative small s protein [Botrytis fragariae]|uniref:Putative small s protein n=1 Tax=Botrytis fragariae TaxID=1964551 RepID=A0A8H6EL81_9HELO|nr:putative small s protein [Botrytis fragariae]KAF5876348.1 putative small s protein [Botrytis fragariae]
MDPVTALGVAAAVIQFIDYGTGLAFKGREIYKSGELGANVELGEATNRLQDLVEPLRSSLHSGIQNAPSPSPADADRALKSICTKCIDLSEELSGLLGSLKLNLIRAILNEEKIQGLKSRLGDLRSNLETHVLVDLRYRMIQVKLEQENNFQTLDKALQAIMQDLLYNHQSSLTNFEQNFDHLRLSQEKEHSHTRSVLVDQQASRHRRQAELSILGSLKFSSMNLRHETIAEAHQQTFEWIFCDPKIEHKPWSNFSEWLKTENCIYWIYGKPGSGKSTLMKFIVGDPRSRGYAETWAHNTPLETPSFFFWNSGDEVQRSQSGLLRIFPKEWKTAFENTLHNVPIKAIDWSLPVLKKSFRTLIEKTSGILSFCFFIDGLDEYEGDYWDIAEYFYELSESLHAKFCLSSRPETGFLDIFRSMPQLKLHDLTESDITNYVRNKLENNSQMRLLMNNSPSDALALITEVVDDGDGVFLWVRLVVNSLLDGLQQRDDISTLRVRLCKTPKEIDDLFDRILSSIDRIYMGETSRIFQLERLMRANVSGSGTIEFYAAYKLGLKSFNQAIFEDETPFFSHQMSPEDYRGELANVLRTRCGGLLELTESTGEVNYIHRTAREYIQMPKRWEALLTHTSDLEFEPWFTFSILHLNSVKARTNIGGLPAMRRSRLRKHWRHFKKGLHYIASSRAKDHILELVEEFDRVAQRYSNFYPQTTDQLQHWYESEYKSTPIFRTNVNCNTYDERCPGQDVSKGDRADLWIMMNLFSVCVNDNVSPYVEMKIISDPSLMRLKYDPPLMVFCFAYRRSESSYPRLRLLVFLLENNANFNEMYHGHSLWKIFLHALHTEYYAIVYHRSFNYIFRAIEIMLQRGADVEVCCIEEKMAWHKNNTANTRWNARVFFFGFGSRNRSDDSASHICENHNKPWEVRHSLERIIKDTFEIDSSDLGAKLLSLVAEKKAEELAIEKQSRNQTPGSSGGNKGRKQKQRNRKKGKGKRD